MERDLAAEKHGNSCTMKPYPLQWKTSSKHVVSKQFKMMIDGMTYDN